MNAWPPHRYIETGELLGVEAGTLAAASAQAAQMQDVGLPAVLSLKHLCFLADVPYEYIRKAVARQSNPYRPFKIAKRTGGFRVIVAVEPKLRIAQRWISDRILTPLSSKACHPSSYAYSPGSSIVRCAKQHVGCKWLIKVDLHRFFESISEIDAYRVFHRAGYQPLVAFELARICTRVVMVAPGVVPLNRRPWPRWAAQFNRRSAIGDYRFGSIGFLPQGAPSSPMLANLVASRLDAALHREAQERGMVYTRYSDDLAFSSRRRTMRREDALYLIQRVYEVLRPLGFRPNLTKTTVVPPGARKIVLGLLVDGDRPRLSRQFRERVETHLHCLSRFGAAAHAGRRKFRSVASMLRHIGGLIDFANMVEAEYAERLKEEFALTLQAQQLVNEY